MVFCSDGVALRRWLTHGRTKNRNGPSSSLVRLKSDPDDEECWEDEGAGDGGICIGPSLRRLCCDSEACNVADKRDEEEEAEEIADIIVKESTRL